MTACVATVTVIDVSTGATVATTREVIAFAVEWFVAKIGTLSVSVLFGNPVATALINAGGGPAGTGSIHPYRVGLSLDGGAAYDAWKMVENPQRDMTVTESGPTLFQGYTVTGVDRVTFHGISLADVLYGAPGTILVDGTATRPKQVMGGLALPQTKGVLRTVPGLASWVAQSLLAYTPVIDPLLVSLLVDGDVWADYLDKALDAFLAQVTGVLIPGDSAPLGSRAQWVEDSSDAALNLTGHDRGLAIGFVGTTPHLTFTRTPSRSDTQAQILEGNGPLAVQAQLGQLLAKLSYEGGASNHNLPSGTTVLRPVIVGGDHAATSTAWYASLCVFCAVDSAGNGGVYYWAHDGSAYRIGQALAARDLVYFAPAHTLYVATDNGVYSHSADVQDHGDWQRVGGLAAKCTRLVVDAQAGANPVIVTQVSGNSVGDGLYITPATSGDTSGAENGYGGWTKILSGSVQAWTYHAAGDELFVADQNDADTVAITFYASDPALTTTKHYPTPDSAHVTALVNLPGGAGVLTAAGALGMYALTQAGVYVDMNADLTLVDAQGDAVLVNSLVAYDGDLVLGTTTIRPKVFALTDAGIYLSLNPQGGNWQASDSQSGIADQNMTALAVGSPQTLVTRITNRLYTVTSNSFYISHSSGIWWDDELQDKVSVGATLSAIATAMGRGPFLDNSVTSLGTIAPGGSTGTSGVNIPGPLPAPFTLGGDLVWVRALDERNKWTYRLVHTNSTSPYNAIEFGEVSEVTADAATSGPEASGKLAQAEVRLLGDRSRLQSTITVSSAFFTTTHALRTLRPTHLVHVTYDTTPIYGIKFVNAPFYVLSHKIFKNEGDTTIATSTSLGTVLRVQPLTMAQVVAGLQHGLSRTQRYTRVR